MSGPELEGVAKCDICGETDDHHHCPTCEQRLVTTQGEHDAEVGHEPPGDNPWDSGYADGPYAAHPNI